MDALKLNVYDDEDNVIKEVEAKVVDLRYGTVRRLMELLKVEDINDTAELLKTVYVAWSQVTAILGKVFPEMTDEDWDGVKMGELLPIIMFVLKSSFAQILSIPTDKKSKNSKAE